MKEVIVNMENNYVCTDELYASFYECPECKQKELIQQSKYCNQCGCLIQWESEGKWGGEYIRKGIKSENINKKIGRIVIPYKTFYDGSFLKSLYSNFYPFQIEEYFLQDELYEIGLIGYSEKFREVSNDEFIPNYNIDLELSK